MIILAKRLGIFCTYDNDGIIDEYIGYLLEKMKKNLSYLLIICNGKLTPEGRDLLEKYADELIVRENVGFDMEAWRQGILSTKKTFKNYDELIIFNDSFYGPFYPFETMFAEMDKNHPEADFWGITVHGKSDDPANLCPYGYIPEHIQSYFLVVRKRLFHSEDFFNYWKNAEVAKTFEEAVKKHEVCMTKYFFDRGFRYAAYCDTREYEKDFDIKFNPYVFFVEKLLKEYHCPIIKKRIFYFGREAYLRDTYGSTPREILKFVKENTNYDVSLIIKNILRKLNIATIKTDLGLNYIIPQTIPSNKKVNLKEAVVVAHLYYEDLMPECVNYLCNVPKEIKIVVVVSNETKKALVEKLFSEVARPCEVRLVNPRGRGLSALYVGCADLFKNFKYLCFIHDKKNIRPGEPITSGEELFHMLWKNFLASEIFIKNTLATLEEDSNLGVLVPPPPYHGRYATNFFSERLWATESVYNKTLNVADSLKIPRKLFNRKLPPPTIGNVFWCRTEALKKITDKNWKVEDFPKEPMPKEGTLNNALERMLAFAAQSEGFYTGWLMTEDFAKDEIENYISFARSHLEFAEINAAAAQNSTAPVMPTPFIPTLPAPHVLFHYFSNLTNIQILKYFLQSRIPHRLWFFFRPFKKLLGKLGFRT